MILAPTLAFIAGVLLGTVCSFGTLPTAVACGVAVLVAYGGRRARARSWVVPLSLCALVAGTSAAPDPRSEPAPRGLARIEARVDSVRASGAFVVVERGVLLDSGAAIAPDLRVFVRELDAPDAARVRVLVALRPSARFRNPSPHPDWLRSAPLAGIATLRGDARVLSSSAWANALHAARASMRERLEETLDARAAGMARALLLGEGRAVDRADGDAFRNAGLAHVLAVSGLHVGLVVGVALVAIRFGVRGRVRDAGRVAALAAIPVALGFAVMAGGAPSAWRAALTATLALAARACHRRPGAVHVSAGAVALLAIADPSQVVRPAFLLSVMATAAVVTTDLSGAATRVAARISWRTTLATAPLVVWCFGGLPPLGILANVLVVPLAVFVLVPGCFLHALASGVGAHAATAGPLESAVDAIVALSEVYAFAPPLPPPSVSQGVVLCACALALLASRTSRARLAVALLGVLSLGACELAIRIDEQPRGQLRVTFADVGQGDGALLDMPDGRLVLVDAGGGIPDPGARALAPLLAARRRSVIDLAIITHPHPDHFAGLLAVMEHTTIREVWHSGQGTAETPHGREASLLRALRQRGAHIRDMRDVCDAPRAFGTASVEVIWPCPGFDPGYDANDNSIVARVRYEGRTLLFTGDVEQLAEGALAGDPRLRADVLKVPHHGSRTSSTRAFLDSVSPSLAVASCGLANRFGHPHAEVEARYGERGVAFFRTDQDGGVVVTIEQGRLRAESFAGRGWSAPGFTPRSR